ncbi:PREDICTED: apoptosis-inducing factor 3-like isoform X1 [Trachymyrmex septentrionalis]|uniref:apoptosis-inducing factor 3-like isoform X1 n=1 Tax=Trachymyrmex septentrionalis TaxID=34720 RepID=UPI00084F7103|nr:PREDICTED: apoptosis-inducing factor 3-like isoform X1 [Trachymyrmex septentrionalis]
MQCVRSVRILALRRKWAALTDMSFLRFFQGTSKEYDTYVEEVVCKQEDINENEMKMLPLGSTEKKILLIKQNGELHAVGTRCTHYGALLNTGALGEGRVRCPLHGACFNIKTGDIEDYPGLDSLPCYKVRVDKSGLVHVKAKCKELYNNRRIKDMSARDPESIKTVVIVGGGPSGATCAESLRQEGFTGRIIMICRENIIPYDRIKVSKKLNFDVHSATLRSPSFYNEHDIETKLGVKAIDLDTTGNIVKLSNNENFMYNYLFVCTGSKPRTLNIPGVNLSNIFVLRNYTDSQGVYAVLSPEKHVVILGLGFIGMEAAAYCVDKCASVTVIGRETVPLNAIFGKVIGNRIKKELEAKGVKFIFENNIKQFIPKEREENVLAKVELTDGQILSADIVIVGIGSTFYTDWMKTSSVTMRDDGSIPVNKHLRTNVENIYAGGDIAYAPILGSDDTFAAIGHYSLAHYHGKIAALNICGKETSLKTVPFFWTNLLGKSYRYAGFGKPTNIKIHGSLDKLEFFAYYLKGGKVIAISSVNADPVVADFANSLYEGKTLTEEEINTDPFGWMRTKPKDVSTRFQESFLVDV